MTRFVLAILLATSIAPSASAQSTSGAQQPPKLVVAISVDQFSADLFAEYRQTYRSGMMKLATSIVFPSGYQSHAATETCPGHSTILTGSHPSRTGIIANSWFEARVTRGPNRSHEVYCAEDENQPGTTSANSDYVVSANHLRVPALGDRMKQYDPRSRVVAVAGKDRAAVMMGGHKTDAIWFFDPKKLASYVTLPGREKEKPNVVKAVNARVRALIDKPVAAAITPSCASRSMPIKISPDHTVGVPVAPTGMFRTTAEFDAATADIAIGLLQSMKLGSGPAADLLTIGLSANDYVGHAFGTEGAEMCLQQAALDQTIGRILSALDATGVTYVVVLTADHGGYDVPERNVERGFADAQRLDTAFNLDTIGRELAGEFKLDLGGESLLEGVPQGDVYLSRRVPEMLRNQLLAAAKVKIMAFPQVETVLTAAEIAAALTPRPPVEDWTLLERARASFYPERSGDLLVFLRPHVIPDAPRKDMVATHGSPWNYDRRVPILFYSPKAIPYEQPLSIETVDILPTLAALIGLSVPANEIDGRCVDLDPGPDDTCS